jgi:4-amino-4-deoxy-L-arabinose transferase-like glycosyltransferase
MIHTIKKYWDEKPLLLILVAGAFCRLLAVIFSKGWGMHDDHFLIIEAAQSWADGTDYNNWLPGSGAQTPSGHSLFYAGLHFLFFKLCGALHFTDPQGKMYVVRFFHAAFSLITIILGYRITFHYADKRTARMAALLLSLYWFMPMLSVRNLVEVVCIPFLLSATWFLIRAEEKAISRFYIYAGLMAGIAFSIRFQSLFFIGGFGLVLLIHQKWKGAFLFGLAAALCMTAVQGPIDYINWHYPFAEFIEYIHYNMENAYSYETQQWYMYFTVVLGLLVPPISFLLVFGFARKWKSHLLLFLPALIFFAFHSYFPNKQERFILPVLPFIIILGMIGWHEFLDKSSYWQKRPKLLRGFWIFFWIVNTIPMLFISVSYSKRDRVESMIYLAKKGDVKTFIIDAGNHSEILMPPLYYLHQWPSAVYSLSTNSNCDSLNVLVDNHKPELDPNYVIFMEDEDLDKRVNRFRECYADIRLETVIQQGNLDAILHFLNPVNKSQTCFIYHIGKRKRERGTSHVQH